MLFVSGSGIIQKSQKHKPLTSDIRLCKRSLVGARGFEPPTSCTPCKRASRAAPRPESANLQEIGRPYYSRI